MYNIVTSLILPTMICHCDVIDFAFVTKLSNKHRINDVTMTGRSYHVTNCSSPFSVAVLCACATVREGIPALGRLLVLADCSAFFFNAFRRFCPCDGKFLPPNTKRLQGEQCGAINLEL